MDLVGFSYIREAADIGRVKKILKKESTGIPIMAKIETQPHRAEVTDVVNAIYDGTDAIMVLEETTLGQFPIEAFQIMAKITPSAAEEFPRPLFLRKEVAVNLQQAISQAASFLAEGVGAEVVITPTESGSTTIRKFP